MSVRKILKRTNAKRVKLNREILESVGEMEAGLTDEGIQFSAAGIIGFAIGLIVLAAVVPDAIGEFYTANTTAWTINGEEDTKTTALWWLLPVIVVAAVIAMIYKRD